MAEALADFGVVGLGRMGGGLSLQALRQGRKVVGFARRGPSDELRDAGLRAISRLEELPALLASPRVVLLYVPAGAAVDGTIAKLAPLLRPGDVIADGGNSYWGDSIRRARRLFDSHGLHLVDLGTSGGVDGARHGACFMAGGNPEAVKRLRPLLEPLAVEGGFVFAGPSGAGHFVKLVHNGIEFGMLQALGEGLALLEAKKDVLAVPEVLRAWRHGSVIRSWLLDLLDEAYRKEGGVEEVPSYVDDTGEVNWLVGDALALEVPIPVIAQSVFELLASRDRAHAAPKAIALMRRGFGGHALGPSEPAERERREGRVDATVEPLDGPGDA